MGAVCTATECGQRFGETPHASLELPVERTSSPMPVALAWSADMINRGEPAHLGVIESDLCALYLSCPCLFNPNRALLEGIVKQGVLKGASAIVPN